MKKLLCCILALLCLIPFACAEDAYDSVRLTFEDGFTLSLPSDWVSYEVSPELAEAGYLYCLGTADASQLMYIQRWATDIKTIDELVSVLENRAEVQNPISGVSDSGQPFLMYTFADADASGCMQLFDGSIVNFVFTPQSSTDLMLTAAFLIATAQF